MKKIVLEIPQDHIYPCDASDKPPFIYGAKCPGFANMIILADKHKGDDRLFKCHDYNNLTDGGGYYECFNSPSLSETIKNVLNRGGEVCQFESLMEFVKWAEA